MPAISEMTEITEVKSNLSGIDKLLVDNAWEALALNGTTVKETDFMMKIIADRGEAALQYLGDQILNKEEPLTEVFKFNCKVFTQIAERAATEKTTTKLIDLIEKILKKGDYDTRYDTPNVLLKIINSNLQKSATMEYAISSRLISLYWSQVDTDPRPANWILDPDHLLAAILLSGQISSKSFVTQEIETLSGQTKIDVDTLLSDPSKIPAELTERTTVPNREYTESELSTLKSIEQAQNVDHKVTEILAELDVNLSPAEKGIANLIYFRMIKTGNYDEEQYKQIILTLHTREIESEENQFVTPKGLELEILRLDLDIFWTRSVFKSLGIKSSREGTSAMFEVKHSPTFSPDWQARLLQELTLLCVVSAKEVTSLGTRAKLESKQDLSLHVNFEIPIEVDKIISEITDFEDESLELYYKESHIEELESRMDVLCYVLTFAYSTEERIMTRKTERSWRTNSKEGMEQTSRGGKSRLEVRVPVFTHPHTFSMLRELDVLVSAMFANFRVSHGDYGDELEKLSQIWLEFENSLRYGQETWRVDLGKPKDTDLQEIFLRYDDGEKNTITGSLIDIKAEENRKKIVAMLKETKVKEDARQLMHQTYLKGKAVIKGKK